MTSGGRKTSEKAHVKSFCSAFYKKLKKKEIKNKKTKSKVLKVFGQLFTKS